MPIDHFNEDDKRTYQNRFWVNDTFYKSGGPVFFVDAGENGVGDDFLDAYLTEDNSRAAGITLAREYHGLAVLWEHRFYGGSLPFPLDPKTGLAEDGWDAYRYLTVDQALQDAVYFANSFKPSGLEDFWDILHPSQTPWMWIGASYPGARAAIARIRNPETFFASWASSAPVQATVDFTTYYEQLSADMTSNCSADIRAAVGYFDTLTETGTEEQIIITKALLYIIGRGDSMDFGSITGIQDAEVRHYASQAGELWQMANILESIMPRGFQTYGFEYSMLPVCNRIEAFDPRPIMSYDDYSDFANILRLIVYPNTNGAADEGLAAKYGAEAAWYGMLSALIAGYGEDEDTSSGNTYHYSADATSWQFQTCSELGFYQVANTNSEHNVLSGYINTTSWQANECGHFFDYPEVSIPANVSSLNKYGGWNMRPSNVMFTSGLKDPWHTVGVQSMNVEIGAPNRTTMQDVPACNEAPANGNVFGLLYPDSYHASDIVDFTVDDDGELHLDSNFALALDLFKKALDVWLPCFNQTDQADNQLESPSEPSRPSNTSPSSPSISPLKAPSYLAVNPAQLVVLSGLILAMLLLAIW